MHTFLYQLKLLLRDKTTIFWTMIFPLILATFFHLAFSQLNSNEAFEPAKLAVIEQKENQGLQTLLQELSQDNDDQLLDVQYVSLKEAQTLLLDEKIDGYVIVNDSLKLVFQDNGIAQTIIQSVIDSYLQTTHAMTSISQIDYQGFLSLVQEKINMDTNYFQSQNISSLDTTVVYFYTLIGMNCMYGGFFGLKISSLTEANLSRQGTRMNISPTSKWQMILTGTIAGFLCQYASMIILLLYLYFGLHVAFGNMLSYILLLTAIGTYVGITIGNLIGNIFRFHENIKTSILTASSLFLSFLSGMMIVDLKYIIQEYIPVLGYINPVNLITDALYALYYYPTFDRFYVNVIILLVMGLLLSVISILLSRRKKYDSL